MTAETRSVVSVNESVLFVAFELSQRSWVVALTTGLAVAPRVQTVPAGDWAAVMRTIERTRSAWKLGPRTRLISCYEAGRDGFWVHRAAEKHGFENRVVDSASIEVNRRARRAKTDRIDACKLVILLVRVCLGDQGAWREVRVPTVAQEAARQVSRERTALTQERTRLINQLRGWLASWGARWPARRVGPWWETVRDWAGQPLPADVQARVARAVSRLRQVEEQVTTLDAQQATTLDTTPASGGAQLVRLKGVAVTSASTLLEEGLVWRQFQNRRQIGGFLGFAPTPYDSGGAQREQGIRRAGNRRLQSVAIQLAWNWVRWQPDSALTRWYLARFGTGKRARRIGIVALARKLVIALWHFVTHGVVPEGAILSVAP